MSAEGGWEGVQSGIAEHPYYVRIAGLVARRQAGVFPLAYPQDAIILPLCYTCRPILK